MTDEIQVIRETVELLKQYVSTPQMREMKAKDKAGYEAYLESVFPSFAENYPYLFRVVIMDGLDSSILERMLQGISQIVSGKESQEEVEKRLGEDLADTFLYPNLPEHIRKKVKR